MLNNEQKKQVSTLHLQGESNHGIAKQLGLTKEYVDAYVKSLTGGSIGLEAGVVQTA